jgi:uncharacterized protein
MWKSCLLAFTLVATSCNSVFYQGDHEKWRQPESINIKCNRDFLNSNDGTRLAAMTCPGKQSHLPTKSVILQFHGNAQNMYAHYQFLAWLIEYGFDLATFDYRGYGDSEGISEREGVYEDARAYIRYARKTFANARRVFYGQSLGGAIMARALIDEGLMKDETYIFEGTFASYRSVARTALARKWFLWPFQWLAYLLVTDGYAPDGDLAVFGNQNVIVIHGTSDPVVDIRHGETLAAQMQAPLWRIENGTHLDTWHRDHGKLRPDLLSRLARF